MQEACPTVLMLPCNFLEFGYACRVAHFSGSLFFRSFNTALVAVFE